MHPSPGVLGTAVTLLANQPGAIVWRLLPFAAAYAGLLTLESVALAKLDRWLPIDSMETATRYSEFTSSLALWLRLSLIGAAVRMALNRWPEDGQQPVGPRFLVLWSVVAAVLAVFLLLIDLWRAGFQFAAEPMSGETMRAYWLASLYVQIVLLYLAARFWFGAPAHARSGGGGWLSAWSATTFPFSVRLFAGLLLVLMVVERVLPAIVSYLPFVAPFWFVPNELSEMRYFVGQGTGIAAESIGIVLYVVFFMAVDRSVPLKDRGG